MPESLMTPVALKFRGLDADQHTQEAILFGRSVQGTARLYHSIALFWLHGTIPQRIVTSPFQIHVSPPRDGSLMYAIYLFLVHGMPMYPTVILELVDLAVPAVLKAIFAHKSGRSPELEKALETIAEMARQHHQLALAMQGGHMQDKERMSAAIEKLASANSKALTDMTSPIGKTARALTHYAGTPMAVEIDEPTAVALRSDEALIVSDQSTYSGKLRAVDTVTGSCRFLPDGETKDLRCKITDPVLSTPENIYTHALDTQQTIHISAKAVLKQDGETKTLYISDARS